MTDRLVEALSQGPLLLDAAMGTRLIERGLRLEDDDPAFWNLARPETVLEIHERDVDAGAGAILTNTFGANRVWLGRFGRADEVESANRLAVALARRAAGPDRLVLGSIGPTAAEDLAAPREQAEILEDAGVDAILFETHRVDWAESSLRRVRPALDVPLLVSLSSWPHDVRDACGRLADLGAAVLGANCQIELEPAARLARTLRSATALPILLKPSAGLPGTHMTSPESFARILAPLSALAPILVGGCCGTTESHVAALRAAWYPDRSNNATRLPATDVPNQT